MQFQPWNQKTEVINHPLGMQQPTFNTAFTETPLNICFLPLLGFDKQGHRLGMGGGFYDRSLATMSPKPLAIGVGLALQKLEDIQPQSHDVAMDYVVTEQAIYPDALIPISYI